MLEKYLNTEMEYHLGYARGNRNVASLPAEVPCGLLRYIKITYRAKHRTV